MIGLAILFLLIGIAAYAFGLNNVGGLSVDIAKLFLVLFVILLLLSLVLGALAPAPYWYYPFGGPRAVVVP
jgi:uncharacterized membrane protein YtjA (UPF0391 family)